MPAAVQLCGVSATNLPVLLLVAIGLTAAAFGACAMPARRATRIEPIVALGE